jgi:acyl-CoA thioester hydrolase
MSSDLEGSSWLPSEWSKAEVRVRYAETDQMGVAYYANFLVWFEVGRTEFCRLQGLPYKDFEKDFESYLAVAEAHCRYLKPVCYDDLLIVRTRIDSFRRRTVGFQYEIINKTSGIMVANGRTLHVLVDANGRPKSFPESFCNILKKSARP